MPFPVLWMYGKYDQLFNYEMAEQFKTENQQLIKMLLSNAGHMGMFEAKDEVIKAIKHFLQICH
jgi:pimeloyl-ACP methyl ester carboxylesterase